MCYMIIHMCRRVCIKIRVVVRKRAHPKDFLYTFLEVVYRALFLILQIPFLIKMQINRWKYAIPSSLENQTLITF